ncbi:MAG: hypothetical protein IJO45_02795 [Oscillospiraceae bacterium]|nr:hypothetical protein [Oscillospiraceae bacterium]
MSMYPDMYGFSDFSGMGAIEDTMLAFLAVYMIVMLFTGIYAIAVYVLQSLGFYTIAKRRGIHNPWLAWIPVGNMWILGSISDQYQYVAKRNVRNRRKTLLGLMIALYALLILIYVFLIAFGIGAVGSAVAQEFGAGMIVLLILLVIVYLALLVVAIVTSVFQYITLYDLFASSKPNSAVLFLVLGILLNFLLPFFIFACRKKDEGMPPRRENVQPAAPVLEAPVAIPEEPVYTQPEDGVTEEDFEPEV